MLLAALPQRYIAADSSAAMYATIGSDALGLPTLFYMKPYKYLQKNLGEVFEIFKKSNSQF